MKHKRSLISVAVATLVLVSLCAVCASTSVSAVDSDSSRASVQAYPAQVAPGTGPSVCLVHTDQSYYVVFVTGNDGALWYRAMIKDAPPDAPDWGWLGGWSSFGGYLTSSPTAVSWGNGRMDIFARGGDGALYHKWFDGGWHDWERLGGVIYPGTGPAVSSWGSGRLDVFVTGTDGALHHKWFDGSGWHDWERLGGYLTASPAAASWSNGRIDVAARGGDGALYHKWFDNGWHGWEDLGGQLASGTGPAVTSFVNWDFYRLDVLVTGTDHALYQKTWTSSSGWSSWARLGGCLSASPSALSWYRYIIVFVPGCDSKVYFREWFNDVWWQWSGAC